MEKTNEFKISTLRSFGSENISFTATIYSEHTILSEHEVAEQLMQVDKVIKQAFRNAQERTLHENEVLAEFSDRKRKSIAELDEAIKQEMKVATEAKATQVKAERLSDKLSK